MQVPLAWKPQFENQCFGVSPFPCLDIFRDSALCTLSVTQMFQLGIQNLTDWACPCCRSVAKLCPTLVTPGTAACQAALVLHCLPEFAQTQRCHRTTYFSVVPFSSCCLSQQHLVPAPTKVHSLCSRPPPSSLPRAHKSCAHVVWLTSTSRCPNYYLL